MARLPSVVSKIPNDLRAFLDRVREALGTGTLLTREDLVQSGVVGVSQSGNLVPLPGVGDSPIIPPAPTGLVVTGALSTIIVQFDKPTYTGHAYAEVWRADTDNLGTAQLIGQTPGVLYADAIGGNETAYYWVRFVSTTNDKGPYNATSGTVGSVGFDPAYLIDVLSADDPKALLFNVPADTTINGVPVAAGVYIRTLYVADGSISNAKIGNLAVDDAKIASLNAAKVTAGVMSGARISAGTLDADAIIVDTLAAVLATIVTAYINTANIVNGAITAAKIADATITNAEIANATIGTAKIADAAITNAQVADAAITNVKIADAAITAAKIANANITAAKIADGNITTAKIGTAQVDTLRIAGNAVTVPVSYSGITTSATVYITVSQPTYVTIVASAKGLTGANGGYDAGISGVYVNGTSVGSALASAITTGFAGGQGTQYPDVCSVFVGYIPAGTSSITVAAHNSDGGNVTLAVAAIATIR